mmetsp:Transcript_50968/g.106471  ORF Transcript_50968/g.106471 Transcript_50968/m.106471 type:complete len:204 (+) Transcript_50968:229-840(+)
MVSHVLQLSNSPESQFPTDMCRQLSPQVQLSQSQCKQGLDGLNVFLQCLLYTSLGLVACEHNERRATCSHAFETRLIPPAVSVEARDNNCPLLTGKVLLWISSPVFHDRFHLLLLCCAAACCQHIVWISFLWAVVFITCEYYQQFACYIDSFYVARIPLIVAVKARHHRCTQRVYCCSCWRSFGSLGVRRWRQLWWATQKICI